MLNEYYVLVDNHLKQVIDKIQKLPEYWKNISHLKNFSDEELKDLTWAGQPNIGWVSIKSEYIKEYRTSPENLELNKNQLKDIISKIVEEKIFSPIVFNQIKITPDDKTRYSFWIKRIQKVEKFNCKINNQYYTFNSEQISDICDRIEQHIQEQIDFEMKIYEQIESCKNLQDFLNINL